MNYSSNSKGVWIMTEDRLELEKRAKEEAVELENPDNFLFYSDPVFLVNKAPTAIDLSYAQERNVPVVVILSLAKFSDIQERMIWQTMNIPDLPFVCIDWAGDHSNVPYMKNKWREAVKERHDNIKAAMKRKYNHAKKTGETPSPMVSEVSSGEVPPLLQNLFKRLTGEDGDEPGMFMFGGPEE